MGNALYAHFPELVALRCRTLVAWCLHIPRTITACRTAVHGGGRGLAVVAAGLLESAVRDLPDHPIALTLFRGTRTTVFTNGEPGGQLRERLGFDYQLVPLAGPPDRVQLTEMGQRMLAGIRAVQLTQQDIDIHSRGGDLPPTAGFLHISGPAVTSSVRQVDKQLELRMFNPSEKTVRAKIDLSGSPAPAPALSRVQKVDFEGNTLDKGADADGAAEVTLKPKEIVTLRLA